MGVGSSRVRLDRALSKLGVASRAEARRLIASGSVRVDGRIARDPGVAVVPEATRITVDGVRARPAAWRAIALPQTARRRHDAPRSRGPHDGVRSSGERRRPARRRRAARPRKHRPAHSHDRHAARRRAHRSGERRDPPLHRDRARQRDGGVRGPNARRDRRPASARGRRAEAIVARVPPDGRAHRRARTARFGACSARSATR